MIASPLRPTTTFDQAIPSWFFDNQFFWFSLALITVVSTETFASAKRILLTNAHICMTTYDYSFLNVHAPVCLRHVCLSACVCVSVCACVSLYMCVCCVSVVSVC